MTPNQFSLSEKKPLTCFLQVTGMTCASCVRHIEMELSDKPGVVSILVGLMIQRAEVKYDPKKVTPTEIAKHIDDLGFKATVLDQEEEGVSVLNVNVKQLKQHLMTLIYLSNELYFSFH